ncbi:MAG: hypothetical protein J5616_02740 [Bacteroidaceae bacterium]|nr:hypothetical protein [Bacteroidaceae bacterium]
MKKILLFVLLGVCVNVKAQYYIVDFTEVDLLGTWDVTSFSGELTLGFNGREYDSSAPTSIIFSAPEDGMSYVNKEGGGLFEAYGYYVTNKQILHFMSARDRRGYTGTYMFSFKIVHYDGAMMILETYTGSARIVIQKRSDNASVRSATAPEGDAAYYNLNGERTDEPSRGINIVREANGDTKKVMVNK